MNHPAHSPLRRSISPSARSRKVLAAAILALLGLCWAMPLPALAHALLVRSDPAQDALLQHAPASVHLWFSEDLNGSASRIVVWDRYRHPKTEGNAQIVPGQPRQMTVRLKPLPAGSYLVLWTSVSAQDGHVLHGFFLFSVKVRGPGPSLAGVSAGGSGQSFPDAPAMASLIAHFFELLAAAIWVGSVFFSAVILPVAATRFDPKVLNGERARSAVLVRVSIGALFLASCVVLALQAYAIAGNSWSSALSCGTLTSVFSVQYGQLWLVRQLLVLLALVSTFMVLRAPQGAPEPGYLARTSSRGSLFHSALPVVLGFIYMYALAASGHAASSTVGTVAGSHLWSLSVFFDWLHLLGVALWLGGQIYLVLVLLPALVMRAAWQTHTHPFLDTLNRFSPVAYVSVVSAGLTGVFSSLIHIPSWYAFFVSIYGRALIVKLILTGLMLLTSAYTVQVMRPRIRRALANPESKVTAEDLVRPLRRWLHVNPILGLGVLLAVSVMFYYPVPIGFSPAGAGAYTMRGNHLVATLTIKPDRSGPNTVTVHLRDDRGRPVKQARVVVLTNMLDMVMGQGLIDLNETSPGLFTGTGDLGMGGHWRLELLVYQPSGLSRLSTRVLVAS
ncbi:MAG: copper resistance protein CopC [Chloroflexota bacterium]|nr:copper resistance protein CopC [Chloroflexota bacterium]